MAWYWLSILGHQYRCVLNILVSLIKTSRVSFSYVPDTLLINGTVGVLLCAGHIGFSYDQYIRDVQL